MMIILLVFFNSLNIYSNDNEEKPVILFKLKDGIAAVSNINNSHFVYFIDGEYEAQSKENNILFFSGKSVIQQYVTPLIFFLNEKGIKELNDEKILKMYGMWEYKYQNQEFNGIFKINKNELFKNKENKIFLYFSIDIIKNQNILDSKYKLIYVLTKVNDMVVVFQSQVDTSITKIEIEKQKLKKVALTLEVYDYKINEEILEEILNK